MFVCDAWLGSASACKFSVIFVLIALVGVRLVFLFCLANPGFARPSTMGCSSSKPDATAAQKQAGAPEQAGPPGADTKDTRAAAAKDAFAAVDKSGDGKVSMPEAKKALEAAFPKLGKYVAKAFLASDDDGSFYLDREEYEAVHTCLASFAAVDTSADGKVSAMGGESGPRSRVRRGDDPDHLLLDVRCRRRFLPLLAGARRVAAIGRRVCGR